jgi:hypothetical protein
LSGELPVEVIGPDGQLIRLPDRFFLDCQLRVGADRADHAAVELQALFNGRLEGPIYRYPGLAETAHSSGQ